MAVGVAWTRICDSSGGGGGSIAVTLSDDTPNFGDVITITATPTGITPTSYTFTVPNDFGGYTKITQAGNTLNWTAVYTGAMTINVDATDGISTPSSTVLVTVTWDFNDAINFNGTTQYLNSVQPAAFEVTGVDKWLIAFWFNADSLTNTPILFSYNIFWFIQIRSTDVRVRFDSSGSGKTYAQTFTTGGWNLVVIQRTALGNNVDVYVNAVQRTTTVGTVGSDAVGADTLRVGGYAASAGFEFDGKLDSVVFKRGYNATLAQIQAYYNSGAGAHPSALGFTYVDSNMYLDGNIDNAGVSPVTFTAINSPTYVTH